MSTVFTDDINYTEIAEAIREKSPDAGQMAPAAMPAAIRAISGGGSTIVNEKQMYYDASATAVSATSTSAEITAREDCIALAVVAARSQAHFPAGWQLLHETQVIDPAGYAQRMYFLTATFKAGNKIAFTVTQDKNVRLLLNLIAVYRCKQIVYHDGTEISHAVEQLPMPLVIQRPPFKYLIHSLSYPLIQSTDPPAHCDEIPDAFSIQYHPISSSDDNQPRLASFWDLSEGTTRTFRPKVGATQISYDCVEIVPEQVAIKDPHSVITCVTSLPKPNVAIYNKHYLYMLENSLYYACVSEGEYFYRCLQAIDIISGYCTNGLLYNWSFKHKLTEASWIDTVANKALFLHGITLNEKGLYFSGTADSYAISDEAFNIDTSYYYELTFTSATDKKGYIILSGAGNVIKAAQVCIGLQFGTSITFSEYMHSTKQFKYKPAKNEVTYLGISVNNCYVATQRIEDDFVEGWGADLNNKVVIGNREKLDQPFMGTIHAIRIYDHELTKEEREQNYLYDKNLLDM